MKSEVKCFFNYVFVGDVIINCDWWFKQLCVDLFNQYFNCFYLLDEGFEYVKVFVQFDYVVFKVDFVVLMIDLQDWWLVDFGYYGGLFVCMVWYSVGMYCIGDGCGGGGCGQQWFVLFNSWLDNVSLDKVWCLLWLIKQKYGQVIFWVDLLIFIGNVVLELMGFKILGFVGGCLDIWELDQDVYWGCEIIWFGGDVCYVYGFEGVVEDYGVLVFDDDVDGDIYLCMLENLLVVVQMGLIYVNLEGLDGNFDLFKVVYDICDIFGCMVMNDEEIVVLIVGGYSFGKIYGVGLVDNVDVELEVVGLEYQGLGWVNRFCSGKGGDIIISGLEVIWMCILVQWSYDFFELFFKYEWELIKSLAGVY